MTTNCSHIHALYAALFYILAYAATIAHERIARNPKPSTARTTTPLVIFLGVVTVESKQAANVVERQPAQLANVTLAHGSVGKQALVLLDLQKTVLDRLLNHKAFDVNR